MKLAVYWHMGGWRWMLQDWESKTVARSEEDKMWDTPDEAKAAGCAGLADTPSVVVYGKGPA